MTYPIRKLLAVVFAAAQALTAADKIVGGPMVVNATPRSATVVWIVESGELTFQPPAGPARKSPSLRVEHHNYQHYLKNGIPYLVSGGGGAPLYDVDTPPAGITQKVVKIENFLTVDVQGKRAHIEAIAIDGKKLDELDIEVK